MNPLYLPFFDEARDNLDAMERGLLALEATGDSQEPLDSIFRCAHSIKGGAAAFGLADIGELTHHMESLLDGLRSRQMPPGMVMVDLLLESVDAVRALLARHQSGAAGVDDLSSRLTLRLQAMTPDREAMPVTRLLEIRIGPTNQLASADAVMQLFRDIPGLGETMPLPPERDDTRAFTVRTSSTDEDLVDLFAFHVAKEQISIRPASEFAVGPAGGSRPPRDMEAAASGAGGDGVLPAAVEAVTIRIAAHKVDHLASLAGELAGALETLDRRSKTLDAAVHAALLADLDGLRHKALLFQQAVHTMRMVPLAPVFNRFARMLRDLAAKLGKQFILVTQGGATEIDKAWVEKIIDPLTHLVRNSCDHGIEAPDERRAAGKPAAGTVTLSVTCRPGAMVISVQDDGRGLVRDQVLGAARARGIYVPDRISDSEVWQFAFVPGLSTAAAVTDLSGRGVGMDVVQRNVAALGGTVEINSVPGQGTCVAMCLPLPLAA